MGEHENLPGGAELGFEVDFSKVTDFAIMPIAKYPAIVFNVEKKLNKIGDAYYFNWTFKLTGGTMIDDESGEEVSLVGRQLWYTTSLKENALWKLRDVLKALGLPVPKKAIRFTPADVLGKPCTLDVGIGEWNNTERNEIIDILPAGESHFASTMENIDNMPF